VSTCEDFTTERLLRLYVSAPLAWWRHDVDVSLGAATKMARFAQLAGVRATFAVMARGEFYNPFCLAGEDALREIHEAGHELIPHVHYYGGSHPSFTVDRDRAIWEAAYPGLFDLSTVAFHMPPREVLWQDYAGFEHAHGSGWEGRYVSDSRREWGPEKEARVSNDMQIALHPEHWFT
jgi:hypothetical protein